MYLIKNANLYAPEKLGTRDLLVINDKIIALDQGLTVSLPGLETVDAKGMTVTPGLIDQHVHVIGGGGEGGPVSRVPELSLRSFILSGTTTFMGVAGTDSVTRIMTAVLGKVRALKEEGLSGWMYTSNYALPPTLMTGSIREDLFLIPEVLGVKMALADHRCSFPTMDELMRILSDIRVGGMIAGKLGVLHVHMGDLEGGIAMFDEAIRRGIPAKHIRPTHCARNERLFTECIQFARNGGIVDITSGGSCFLTPPKVIEALKSEGVDLANITMSTDGGGSIPRFDAAGNMVGLGTGSLCANIETLREMVAGGHALETVLPLISSNVARHLELPGKGEVKPGNDADLCFFDDTLSLRHVMARGRFLMRDGEVVAKGLFEE